MKIGSLMITMCFRPLDLEEVQNSVEDEWVQKHLKPLSAAYKSVTGTPSSQLQLNNGQSILPPGFINT